MKVLLYTAEGKEKGNTEFPATLFDVPMNADLLHQAVRVLRLRQRKVVASTKTRGEVSGGGKKPWRQKGTGRARHGSIRSPQWKGGGVVFGPTKERVYSATMPVKMRKAAMRIALSAKARDGQVMALEGIKNESGKTKEVAAIFNTMMKLHTEGAKRANTNTVMVVASPDEKLVRASRNIPSLRVVDATRVNLGDIMSAKYFVIVKDAVPTLQKRFEK